MKTSRCTPSASRYAGDVPFVFCWRVISFTNYKSQSVLLQMQFGIQANAVANAAEAHAIAAEAAQGFADASHENLDIAAALGIDDHITDLLPTLHDIWSFADADVSLDHYVALVHAHSSQEINSATSLAEAQMQPTHEWIPAEVMDASNSTLWQDSLHVLAATINATVSSAISEQVTNTFGDDTVVTVGSVPGHPIPCERL